MMICIFDGSKLLILFINRYNHTKCKSKFGKAFQQFERSVYNLKLFKIVIHSS